MRDGFEERLDRDAKRLDRMLDLHGSTLGGISGPLAFCGDPLTGDAGAFVLQPTLGVLDPTRQFGQRIRQSGPLILGDTGGLIGLSERLLIRDIAVEELLAAAGLRSDNGSSGSVETGLQRRAPLIESGQFGFDLFDH